MAITIAPPPVPTLDENSVIRTDSRWDNMVKHLGYQSVNVPPVTSDTVWSIPTDKDLIRASQERLRKAAVIPDEKLERCHLAHLKLARAIAARVFNTPPPVYVAVIPPASDRVRTAGMYSTTTTEVYIALEMMGRGKTMIDTLVHELGHHQQYRSTGEADDLTPVHAESMTRMAAEVIELVTSGAFDDLLREVTW